MVQVKVGIDALECAQNVLAVCILGAAFVPLFRDSVQLGTEVFLCVRSLSANEARLTHPSALAQSFSVTYRHV